MSELACRADICELLEWDTRFFGFPVARLRDSVADRNVMATALRWCDENGVRCLYWLADSAAEDSVRTAFAFHFRFVDVRLELSAPLAQMTNCVDLQLRPAQPDDIPALGEIAAVSHRDSRFCRDSGFPAGAGDRLFRAWIERDVLSPNSMVWVYTDSAGHPVGYASCQFEPSAKSGIIGLIAVSSKVREQGVGRCLLNRCHEWLFDAGAQMVRVVTQGANIPAQRLYAKAGYTPARADYWFHRWFPM